MGRVVRVPWPPGQYYQTGALGSDRTNVAGRSLRLLRRRRSL